jgi:CNT family concentrative nucleoside transporter
MTALWVLQTAAERLAEAQAGLDTPLPARLMGLVGIVTMLAIAVALSYDRKRIDWRLVASGLALQTVFGLIVLKTGPGKAVFAFLGRLITGLLSFQEMGARFVFGNLVQSNVPVGLPGPGGGLDTSGGLIANTGAYFAFNVLPTIIFFSALMSVLYY